MLHTSRLSLPYPESSDTADPPRDIGALAQSLDSSVLYSEGALGDRPAALRAGRIYRAVDTGSWSLDTGTAWVALQPTPPRVSALPGAPVDGQEIYYAASDANGVVWHLRYNAASASPYKWECIGGPALSAEVASAGVTATGAVWTDTGAGITVPLAGDYVIEYGTHVSSFQGGPAAVYLAPKIGAAAIQQNPDGNIAVPVSALGTAGYTSAAGIWRAARRNVAAAATLVKLQYQVVSAGQYSLYGIELHLRPVRVG
jgi:hypothetical protein